MASYGDSSGDKIKSESGGFRKVAVKAAKEAGKVLKENFGHVREIHAKGGNWRDLVTNVDIKANDIIMEILKKKFPGHNIHSEESRPIERESEYTWHVDPLDGTTNYTLAIPYSATCIGLVFRDRPILGVVYNPMTGEMFMGEHGKGATLNGDSIRVSSNNELRKTLVTFCHNYSTDSGKVMGRFFDYFKENAKDYRKLGSGNLEICWVACGRNDVYFRPDVVIHDIVPAYVIAKEAGARMTDWEGREWTTESKNLIVTNGTGIHEKVIEAIKRHK